VWTSFAEAIPYVPNAGLLFSMPKSRISCNKKRGAHLTNDTVLLTDLDQSFDVPVVKASSGLSTARALSSVSVPPSDEEQSVFLVKLLNVNQWFAP